MSQRFVAAAGTACALLLSHGALAQATDHQIPYQGQLDLDGVPMNGQFNFWFELYATPTGGDCQTTPPPNSDCLWAGETTGVQVVGGHFSVVLGGVGNPLGDAVWQNPEVYLGVRVAAAGDGYTALAGRQRILAVPLAARAETAKNYHVTGDLRVAGAARFDTNASVAGALSVGSAGNTLALAGNKIDAAGGTLYLQSNVPGEVRANGPVRGKCPAGTTRIGSWCIENTANSATTHAGATLICHNKFMVICPIEVLMACDQLNISTSECGSVTDDSGSTVWTAGPAYDSPYANSMFSEIAVYNGNNTIDRTDSGASKAYFCCVPGYFY